MQFHALFENIVIDLFFRNKLHKSSNDIDEDEYQNYLKTSQIDSDI